MSDDIFDSVIHIESNFITQGAEEGKRAGEQAGYEEGRSLGYRKGFDVSREFASYYGQVQAWLHLSSLFPDKFPARYVSVRSSLSKPYIADSLLTAVH
jgi:hypothetical protein